MGEWQIREILHQRKFPAIRYQGFIQWAVGGSFPIKIPSIPKKERKEREKREKEERESIVGVLPLPHAVFTRTPRTRATSPQDMQP